jgi:hypothetical protein
MSNQKADGKDKKKSSQLVIRLDKTERDVFVKLCERMHTSAAREIRRFMREFVSANSVSELGAGVELETAVVPQAPDDAPVLDAVAAPEPESPVEVAVDETDRPKKKPKRVQQ